MSNYFKHANAPCVITGFFDFTPSLFALNDISLLYDNNYVPTQASTNAFGFRNISPQPGLHTFDDPRTELLKNGRDADIYI